MIPYASTYCPNTTAANAQRIDAGPVSVWYSYRTPVAVQVDGGPVIVRENEWGPTTGKHLNAIDGGDKRSRVSSEAFLVTLAAAGRRLEAGE